MGKVFLILLIIVFLSVAFADKEQKKKEIQKQIDRINNAQKSWTAEYTKFSDLNPAQKRSLLGSFQVMNESVNIEKKEVPVASNIPRQFDARTQWPYCSSIASIKDQGSCESCWAVSTAAAASDRLCIASNYRTRVNISAENIISCCSECAPNGGCNTGWPILAWKYLTQNGVVTGGDYGSYDGCQPYEIYPSGFRYQARDYYTPPCSYYCTNNYYNNYYSYDFHYGNSAYNLQNNPAQIQSDILNYGPNVATFKIYEDFYHYRSGVYQYVYGNYMGSHAVRTIGWGTENGVDYWLIANSWSRQFGLNGVFKIRRGVNECGIEEAVTAGLMSS